jgi:cobalt-zinc-cadmium efflux system membrane fusion protein
MCVCAGCGSREAPAEPERHDDVTEATSSARPADNMVRIAPDMLRDLKITTLAVEAHEGGDEASMLGELRVDAERYAEVTSPITAQVLRLHVGANARVREGEALAELRSVELGRARAEHMRAQARVDLARQALDRKRTLASERIVAQREVQEAEMEVTAAQAEVRAALAGLRALGAPLDAAGDDPSAFILRAPLAGTVIERTAAVGQQADPSVPLFRIAGLERLWLVVQAFERDAARVRPGAAARITFAALPGRPFTSQVAQVGSQVEADSRTVPIRIMLANRDGVLRPGMSASASIRLGGQGTTIVAVPAAAVQRLQEDWVVFIPRDQGTFEMRAVGRGRDMGGEVEILSGLKVGETVVVEGAFLLKAEAEKARGTGEAHEHGG